MMKKNEEKLKSSQKYPPSKQMSVRQIISSEVSFENIEYNSKCIPDLLNKREIAEASLVSIKKKCLKNLSDMTEKYEQVRGEHLLLSQKLEEKRQEKTKREEECRRTLVR